LIGGAIWYNGVMSSAAVTCCGILIGDIVKRGIMPIHQGQTVTLLTAFTTMTIGIIVAGCTTVSLTTDQLFFAVCAA